MQYSSPRSTARRSHARLLALAAPCLFGVLAVPAGAAPPRAASPSATVPVTVEAPARKSIAGAGVIRLLMGGVLGIGNLFDRGGINASSSSGISAVPYQFRVGTPGAFIKITWSRGNSVNASDVLGYVIWRGSLVSPLEVIGGLDGDSGHTFVDSESSRTPTAYNGQPSTTDAGTRTTFPAVQGVVPGQVYAYQVSCAYTNHLEDRTGTAADTDTTNPDAGKPFMSPLSVASRYVTAIGPSTITGVNGQTPDAGLQVDLKAVTVEWQQTAGADQYVIWVSADPSFRGSSKTTFSGGRSVPVNLGGPATLSRTINASKPGLRKHRRLYIAVGARKSGEPKPQPLGAIFSAPVSIQNENAPPPPPGSAGAAARKKAHRK